MKILFFLAVICIGSVTGYLVTRDKSDTLSPKAAITASAPVAAPSDKPTAATKPANPVAVKAIATSPNANQPVKQDSVYQQRGQRTLRSAYRNYFPVGAAITPETDLTDPETARLLKTQFSSLTPKQALQPFKTQPQEGVYNWKAADQMVDFAQRNNMKVRGHCLIYSSRDKHMPAWFYLDNGATASRDVVLKRMKDHITTEVSRYKGKIYCWDVVNEAISNKTAEYFMPDDPLYQIVGEDYVAKAFEYAHAADPTAKLFYNDSFDDHAPKKRDKIFKLLKGLKDKGVPINGIGMQCHLGINGISRAYLQETISLFKSIGLEFQVTELDISIYRRYLKPAQMSVLKEDYSSTVQNEQAAYFKMIFDVCRQNKGTVTGITFWGSFDNDNEKNSLTKRMGKRNYPLMFDKYRKPKKAFDEVTNF